MHSRRRQHGPRAHRRPAARRCPRPAQISVGESVAAAREALARDLGVRATADNRAAISGAAVVVLAVKPPQAAAVLQPLAAALRAAPGRCWCRWPRACASRRSPAGAARRAVVRAMPNRPALVGAGVTGLYAPPGVVPAQRLLAERVMRSVGEIVWVPGEDALDVVTALSGSGPAYFFLLAELLAEAGEQLGPRARGGAAAGRAHPLRRGTAGAGRRCATSRLRAEVTSQGGTTEAALRVLESADLRATVARALAAAARSREPAELESNAGIMSALIFHRRDTAVAGAVRVPGTAAAAVDARRLPQRLLPGGGAHHQSADPAAAARAAAGRQGRHRLGGGGAAHRDHRGGILFALHGLGVPPLLAWVRQVLVEIARTLLWTYFYAHLPVRAAVAHRPGRLFAAAVGAHQPVRAGAAADPAPDSGDRGLDLSPLWAIIAIQALLILMR